MSQPTASQASRPSGGMAQWIAKYHDMLPVFCVALMAVGFLMYWSNSGHPESWQYVLGRKILVPYANLFILLYLVFSNVLPGLVQSLSKRHDDIKEGIRTFEERNDVLSQQYRETREKLENVDGEIEELLQRAEKLAEEEKTKTIEQAEKQAVRIEKDCANILDQETRKLQQNIKRDMIEEAFDKAQAILKTSFGNDDQNRHQTEYLQQLENRS
ncbi:MAG: hypothetical protein CL920_28615 [Deltaproteobacteria bacterium]|nr:hypothetical protein [Deltaproteobacteria bacterium]|tara:strand:- start:1862 stop:2503 length:642 start_codon:yes stop_codon:yes gene_type:complete